MNCHIIPKISKHGHAGVAIQKFLPFPVVLLVHSKEVDIKRVETASIYVLIVHCNTMLKYWLNEYTPSNIL